MIGSIVCFWLVPFVSIVSSDEIAEWRCRSGEMIPENLKCDIFKDCRDGSDESVDVCGPFECPPGKFACSRIRECIGVETLCDGFKDCWDGTDESSEICQVTTNPGPTCPMSEFPCENGLRCLGKRFLCDGDDDCGDSSDEKFEMCCNSRLDIGNNTSPCSRSSSSLSLPPTTPASVPNKCLKRPCSKKCKKFWDILIPILQEKVKAKTLRKCKGKKANSKRCVKCRGLLERLALKTVSGGKPEKSNRRKKQRGNGRRKKRCEKNPQRKGCKKSDDLL